MQQQDMPLDAAFDAARAQEAQELLAPTWFEDNDPVALDVQAALFNGYLTHTVTIGTHNIVLRTLKIGEEFEVALVADKYKDTFEAVRSLATATVAASIQSIDGGQLIRDAMGPRDLTLDAKYAYVLDNYYSPVIDRLYAEYRTLRQRMLDAFEALGKG